MICKYCDVEGVVYAIIISSGAKVIGERCPKCGQNTIKGKPFLSKTDYVWESLPLLSDATASAEPCSVKGCNNKGVQLHHFAPRHLFNNADDWATGYLCQKHHEEWHERTNTGIYYYRVKNEYRKDKQ